MGSNIKCQLPRQECSSLFIVVHVEGYLDDSWVDNISTNVLDIFDATVINKQSWIDGGLPVSIQYLAYFPLNEINMNGLRLNVQHKRNRFAFHFK